MEPDRERGAGAVEDGASGDARTQVKVFALLAPVIQQKAVAIALWASKSIGSSQPVEVVAAVFVRSEPRGEVTEGRRVVPMGQR
ncbi:MAG: hypothetical protein HKL85_12510 [Acidimicrobiaceae bacterium]|nr:hypothetical protein [Acidimicrobiaceae bacterium]